MEDQASSQNFLSAIFGIFGIFWVEICGRKNFRRKFLIEKIFDWKNIFARPKKIYEKVNEKSKISKFRFFELFFEISKFSIFIDFFIDFLFENFLVSKNIFRFSIEFFRSKMFRRNFFRSHISSQKIMKIPKITLRKLFDEAWSSIQHHRRFPPQLQHNPIGFLLT